MHWEARTCYYPAKSTPRGSDPLRWSLEDIDDTSSSSKRFDEKNGWTMIIIIDAERKYDYDLWTMFIYVVDVCS